MKRLAMIAGIMLAFSAAAAAQYFEAGYKVAVGVRLYPSAVSLKYFVQPAGAIEGLVYIRNIGTRATALYEQHFYLGNLEGLTWFIGGGAHAEFQKKYAHANSEKNNPAIGIDAIAGIDYKIPRIPLNVSFDWQPSKTFINDNYTDAGWASLSVRAAF